ncbi:hypothetical protein DV735_g4907, partial [Chaetothyriales sp. CBS 134920]
MASSAASPISSPAGAAASDTAVSSCVSQYTAAMARLRLTAAAAVTAATPKKARVSTGPVASPNASSRPLASTTANETPLTHYHSFFYELLSWENPRTTAITFASVVLFILASRYLPIIRWLLKFSWVTLGVVTLSELASKAVLGSSVASSFRPRRYYTIPKETLEATLEDVQHLVNFFVIETQRIVFAENIPVTAAAFVTAFASYFLIKLLPAWGLALLGTTVIFVAPLIYIKNQEAIDSHVAHATKVASAQASHIRQVAGQHAGKGYQAVKGYTGEYANKAGVFVGQARQTIPLVNKSKPAAAVKESDFPTAPAHDLPKEKSDSQPSPAMTSLESFEQKLTALTSPGDKQKLPGLILTVVSVDPSSPPSSPAATVKEVYHKSFGATSIDPAKARPLTRHNLFWIASCTKLFTSIAVLQIIERGLIGLDDPVEGVLPELKDPDIIVQFSDDGAPELVKAKNKITVRQLITHTNGLSYDFIHPKIARWWKWKGRGTATLGAGGARVPELYGTPLVFEPGTSWSYSPGLDWAGILVARLTGHKSLGDYYKQHILGPLGIPAKDAAFRKADLQISSTEWDQRFIPMTVRLQPNGDFDIFKTSLDGRLVTVPPVMSLANKDDQGGGGLITTPDAYVKVLSSLLADDGKLLKHETVAKLFLPAISDENIEAIYRVMKPEHGGLMLTGGLPLPGDPNTPESERQEYHHSLVGLLNRPKGSQGAWTLSWTGLPNMFWWIDREHGLAGLYASQLIPAADPPSVDAVAHWRKVAVKEFGQKRPTSNL